MKHITRCILCTFLLLFSFASSANTENLTLGNQSTLPITLQTLLENSGRGHMVDVIQQGALNQLNIAQIGEQNWAYIMQVGEGNTADILQLGSNNEVELLQAGENNNASVIQVGDDNRVQLNQLGSANFSIEQIADGAAITITQY